MRASSRLLRASRKSRRLFYLDHRGNGRSDRGDPSKWKLAQWGDDVRAFARRWKSSVRSCSAFPSAGWSRWRTRRAILSIRRSCAEQHGRVTPAGSNARDVREAGGPERAKRRADFRESRPEQMADYQKNVSAVQPDAVAAREYAARRMNPKLMADFFCTKSASSIFYRPWKNKCPTLITAGDLDPITPLADSKTSPPR